MPMPDGISSLCLPNRDKSGTKAFSDPLCPKRTKIGKKRDPQPSHINGEGENSAEIGRCVKPLVQLGVNHLLLFPNKWSEFNGFKAYRNLRRSVLVLKAPLPRVNHGGPVFVTRLNHLKIIHGAARLNH